jgi:hypothetical protein
VPVTHSPVHTTVQAFLILQVANSDESLTDESLCLVNPLEFFSLTVVILLHPEPYERMERADYSTDCVVKYCNS